MTKMQVLLAYLHENPKATNKEICEALDMAEGTVRTYIYRAERQGRITSETTEDGREIVVKLEEARPGFKQETLMMMAEAYLDDFAAAVSYSERLEIGKMILRILEKL